MVQYKKKIKKFSNTAVSYLLLRGPGPPMDKGCRYFVQQGGQAAVRFQMVTWDTEAIRKVRLVTGVFVNAVLSSAERTMLKITVKSIFYRKMSPLNIILSQHRVHPVGGKGKVIKPVSYVH